jgi:hypothetical protein
MEMRQERDLQVGGLKRRNVPVENSRLGATYHTRSEINQIGAIVNNDGGRRTGTIGIWHRRARTE